MKRFSFIIFLFCCFFNLSVYCQNVGIGTNTPGAKLEVNGNIKIDGGSPAAGRVLTTVDGTGLATWEDVPAPSKVAFKTYLSVDQAIPSFSDTKLNFGINFGFDDSGSFDDIINSFKVPSDGLYYFHVSINISLPTTVNPTIIRINRNGALLAQASNAVFQSTASYRSTIDISCIQKLTSADLISVSAITYDGSTISNYSASTFFEGYKIY